MSIRRAYVGLPFALALLSVTLFRTSAYGQSQASPSGGPDSEVVAAQGPRLSETEKKVAADGSRPRDLETEVVAMKAENAAVREQLRKMEEQQKALLEIVDRLQRKLDGVPVANSPVANSSTTAQPAAPAQPMETSVPSPPPPDTSTPSPSISPAKHAVIFFDPVRMVSFLPKQLKTAVQSSALTKIDSLILWRR